MNPIPARSTATTTPGPADHQPDTPATIGTLIRIRWAIRATLLLGVTTSVAANTLHAQPHLVSQLIAAWPPVALLLTVELISRVPVHRKLLAATRLVAATTIAGIAAWVSYRHMTGVAIRYGETGLSAYLLPLSVDGLVIVASISLVELTNRLRAAQPQPRPAAAPSLNPPAQPTMPHRQATLPGHAPRPVTRVETRHKTPLDARSPVGTSPGSPSRHPKTDPGESPRRNEPATPDRVPDDTGRDTGKPPRHRSRDDATPQRPRRGTTRKAVIDTHLQHPTMHPTAIADLVGTSERSVRRYLDEFRAETGTGPTHATNAARRDHNNDPR